MLSSIYAHNFPVQHLIERVPPVEQNQKPIRFYIYKINRAILTQEAFVMASKAAKTGNKRGGFSTTFVNYKLDKSETAAFKAWFTGKDGKNQDEFITAMGKSMKFSISENLEEGFYLASMTCKDEGNVNMDHCITSRSPEWWEAICLCIYKGKSLGWDKPWADQAASDDWG